LKYDKVKLEYWDKGIDTPDIPLEVLEPYLEQDVRSTWKVFQKQIEELLGNEQLKRLIWYGCQDLLATQEMEWNGLKFDLDRSLKLGEECLDHIREIDRKLGVVFGDYPFVNWNSGDHLSAILYGGILKYKGRESVSRVLKDGRVSVRERDVVKEVTLPTLVEPLKGTNLKKDGYYETNEEVLKSLKAYGKAKAIISLVLDRAKIEKQVGTYYHGFPKLYKEKDWQDNILHGQLNHCVAKTGRLSSSAPNQQNLNEGIKQCLISRFY
jgi:DNA polymerase I-like protein with 3'-5' exonuclease and polymerase domains